MDSCVTGSPRPLAGTRLYTLTLYLATMYTAVVPRNNNSNATYTRMVKLFPHCKGMYPLCKDCLHHKLVQCKKTKVSMRQSRDNPCLCGEDAVFFSPTFLSLYQTRKEAARHGIEDKVLHQSNSNRTISHCSCKCSDRRLREGDHFPGPKLH
jgi:hypothetical protein